MSWAPVSQLSTTNAFYFSSHFCWHFHFRPDWLTLTQWYVLDIVWYVLFVRIHVWVSTSGKYIFNKFAQWGHHHRFLPLSAKPRVVLGLWLQKHSMTCFQSICNPGFDIQFGGEFRQAASSVSMELTFYSVAVCWAFYSFDSCGNLRYLYFSESSENLPHFFDRSLRVVSDYLESDEQLLRCVFRSQVLSFGLYLVLILYIFFFFSFYIIMVPRISFFG